MVKAMVKSTVKRQLILKRRISALTIILPLFLTFISVVFISIIFASVIFTPELVLAEERNIFVGDIIEIKVFTDEFTEDEIKEKFKSFEIVNLVKEDDGYILSIRTFETGQKKILLGDKEIIIDVKSTLDEIERDGIFEGSLNTKKPAFNIEWRYIFYVLLITSFLSGVITFWKYIKNRRKSSMSAYKLFLKQTENIPLNDSGNFVKLTLYFKEFLETIFSCRIRGKTTSEIINEINCYHELQAYIPDIKAWMEECDSIKFSGTAVSNEKKEALYRHLRELVKEIWENTAADAKRG